MVDVYECIKATIAEHDLCAPDSPLVLMVSGGGDSTALCYLAYELREAGVLGSLSILHVNHCLRGSDADADEAFVCDLAALLNIPFISKRIDIQTLSVESGENVEALARRKRYQAAEEALETLCALHQKPLDEGRIVVAHNADDRIENFYMRSIVGTGPGGFRSMKYRNRAVIRPLLDVSREDLREYLRERDRIGLPVMHDEQGALWREDATNAHTDRFRAFVRMEMVPLAKERNPHLDETLIRTMNLIADEDDMLQASVDEFIANNVDWLEEKGEGCLVAPVICAESKPLQRRIIAQLLRILLGDDARLEAQSIEAVLKGVGETMPLSGYVNNIQGNLAVSANKHGIRIEPMNAFRARRKKI